jgi:peptidoglycan/LPS O-acetylase OafA/YrhL
LRWQQRAERRATRRAGGYGWLGGVVLIVIGAIYMLQNAGLFTPFSNWWALFLLIPAAGALATAFGIYRRNEGNWAAAVTGPLLGGLFLIFLTAAFLFELNFGLFWPLLLIGGGLLLLLTPLLARS